MYRHSFDPLQDALFKLLPRTQQQTIALPNGSQIRPSVLTNNDNSLFDAEDFFRLLDDPTVVNLLPKIDGNDYQDPNSVFYKAAKYIKEELNDMTGGSSGNVHKHDSHTVAFTAMAIAIFAQQNRAALGNPNSFHDVYNFVVSNAQGVPGGRTVRNMLEITEALYHADSTDGTHTFEDSKRTVTIKQAIVERLSYALRAENTDGRYAALAAAALTQVLTKTDMGAWTAWAFGCPPFNDSPSAWYNQFILETLYQFNP